MPHAPIASDRLRARDNGPWGREKLQFLDAFGPPALRATSRKLERWHIDLFAGPGMNVERGTGDEFRGSPIRVLHMTADGRRDIHFTHAVFVNADRRDHAALRERVDRSYAAGGCAIAQEHVRVMRADANEALPSIMAAVHPDAYAFVFADLEAPRQWPWQSVRELRTRGHRSVDLYMLFPLDMAIVRLCAYNRARREKYANILSEFFGTDDWRQFADARLTDTRSSRLRQELTDLYIAQLKTIWKHAGVVKDVYRTGRHALYRMLFASDDPGAQRIASWARRQGGREQQLDQQFGLEL
ncbi:MAG: three-Cys-motif partner protein TcmP [Gemmatimonadaceae bacterium]